jgi:hypothetical protein
MENFNVSYGLFFLLIVFLFQTNLSAQDFDDLYGKDEKKNDSLSLNEKIYFGGDLSLSFGSSFYFSVSPEVGYKVLPRLHLGGGLYYMHSSSKLYNYSISVYGARAYVRPFPLKKLFLQAEAEMLNTPRWDQYTGYTEARAFVPGLLAGIGYMEQGAGRLGFYVALLYNFTISDQTPYTNPVIRTGLVF